jgi:hypothetical protein
MRRTASPSRIDLSIRFFCVGLQHFNLQVREQALGGKIWARSAQQRHLHDSPAKHEMDGDGALESLGRLVLQSFDATSAFQYPPPVFNAPM